MHSSREVETVQRLFADGWNNCQIARSTGIPLSTIWHWRHGHMPIHSRVGGAGKRPSASPRCDGVPLDEPAYAYLLGLYLGDGYINRQPRTYRFHIFQDQRYVALIELARQAICRVRGSSESKVSIIRQIGCVAVSSYWNHWPCIFPQHGPGPKHLRPMRLEHWQLDIVRRYPKQLLRGLIHSDGCRAMNRVWEGKYTYPRYFFTNTSTDILQIFRNACDAVGIRHRNTKPTTISIARREDVAALDAFIGPKG